MTLKFRHVLFFALFGLVVGLLFAQVGRASITDDVPTPLTGQIHYTFFATSSTDTTLTATTTSTSTDRTSFFDSNGRLDTGKLLIAGAEKVTFYFGRTVHGTGNSRFELEVSPDGTNWYDFDRLIIEDGSNTATTTYTITSTSTEQVSMDLTYHTYKFVRCIVVETTDGTQTCSATVEY